MTNLEKTIPVGVLTGDEVQNLFAYAKERKFALAGANCVGTNSVNAALETAAELNAPVIIQFSTGGAVFFAGKGLSNEGQRATIAGGISGAMHVHQLAELYGARVVLHTDHCPRESPPLVGWAAGCRGSIL